jgi:hypothetical protein
MRCRWCGSRGNRRGYSRSWCRSRASGTVNGAAADLELLANRKDPGRLTIRHPKWCDVSYILGAIVSFNFVTCVAGLDCIVEASARWGARRRRRGWCSGNRSRGRRGYTRSRSRGRRGYSRSWCRRRASGAVNGAAADLELLANRKDPGRLTNSRRKWGDMSYILGAIVSFNFVTCVAGLDCIVEASARWGGRRRRRRGHRWGGGGGGHRWGGHRWGGHGLGARSLRWIGRMADFVDAGATRAAHICRSSGRVAGSPRSRACVRAGSKQHQRAEQARHRADHDCWFWS